MIIDTHRNIVWITNGKCGSTSLEATLGDGGYAKVIRPQCGWQVPDKCKGCRICFTIRNPYARLVSFWTDRTQGASRAHYKAMDPVWKAPFHEFVPWFFRWRRRLDATCPRFKYSPRYFTNCLSELHDLVTELFGPVTVVPLESICKSGTVKHQNQSYRRRSGKEWWEVYRDDVTVQYVNKCWATADCAKFGYTLCHTVDDIVASKDDIAPVKNLTYAHSLRELGYPL